MYVWLLELWVYVRIPCGRLKNPWRNDNSSLGIQSVALQTGSGGLWRAVVGIRERTTAPAPWFREGGEASVTLPCSEQVKCDPEGQQAANDVASRVRSEYVIRVAGTVRLRPSDMINKKMATGEVEVRDRQQEA